MLKYNRKIKKNERCNAPKQVAKQQVYYTHIYNALLRNI